MLTDDELALALDVIALRRGWYRSRGGMVRRERLEAMLASLDSLAAKLRAIAAPQVATPDMATAIKSVEGIKATSTALGYSPDYMAAIDRVLTCLRAVAENGGPLTSTLDAAPRGRRCGSCWRRRR